MAHYYREESHTFNEYLLIPGYTDENCIPANVSLETPLVKYRPAVEEQGNPSIDSRTDDGSGQYCPALGGEEP